MYVATNVELVRALLHAAATRVRRFVLVSSADVYGSPSTLPITEEFPFAPNTFFAETKLQAERVLRDVAPRLKIEFAIVRPAGIYGHGDHGPVDRLVKHIAKGRYAIAGDGKNSLHHIHLDDVLEGIFGATALSARCGRRHDPCGPGANDPRRPFTRRGWATKKNSTRSRRRLPSIRRKQNASSDFFPA